MIIFVLLGVVVVGAGWNFFQAGRAKNGVQFDLPYAADVVGAALSAAFLGTGMKARAKAAFRGVELIGGSGGRFTYGTKYGDQGQIDVTPNGSGSRVFARTSSLVVGANRTLNPRTGFYQLVVVLQAMFLKMIYYRPNAPKMVRFQNGLQKKLEKELGRQARPS